MPTMLITTAGADPSKELHDFAMTVVGPDRYKSLAMGGGTHDIALDLVKSASSEGNWVCFQNLHLVVAWLPALEKVLNAITPTDGFRLWLTTEAHAAFPRVLLQQSLKVTFESPPGTKKNMQRTLSSWGRSYFEQGGPAASSLLFILAWFHAIAQERRTYIPQGWTKSYEFSVGDLRAGSFVMEATAKANPQEPDFAVVHGLMEDAIYGGRVDNPYDCRILQAYLKKMFTQETFTGNDDLAKGLTVPRNCTYDDCVSTVARLSDTDAPILFGLPDNIERSIQRTSSAHIIDQLRKLTVNTGASMKFDREVWRSKLQPLLDQWDALVQKYSALNNKKPPAANASQAGQDPIVEFVAMEVEIANALAATVRSSLNALKKVLFGTALLTPYIQSIAVSLISGAVPGKWSKMWDGPEKPGAYLSALGRKAAALSSWESKASSGKLLEDEIDLNDVFRPSTFLNAVRQLTARQSQCPMDGLQLESGWSRNRLVSKISIICHGLLLQGAELQGTNLIEAAVDAHELVRMPPLALGFAPQKDIGNVSDDKLIVPIYMDTTREKLLTDVALDIRENPAVWILAGVSIFLTDAT